MNKTTFSFEDIASKPTAIFVIARDENKSLNAIVAMFIEQLYAILVDLKSKNKFNFVLDNFDIIEKCNDLVDILGSCVARNIKTYIATRSVSELENIYGSYMPKLCDLLSIENTKVKLVINQAEEMFDLENLVKDAKMKQLSSTDFSKFNLGEPFKADDLIKSIDAKIEQLELEEKMAKMNKKDSEKSELEQFKTENMNN